MAEQVPGFHLGFDCIGVENSDEFEESSGLVACNFNKNWSSLIKSRNICLSKILPSGCVD